MNTKLFFALLLYLICTFMTTSASDNIRSEKNKILIANPTAANISTLKFLIENNILNIDVNKTEFTGVYYVNQNYNFEESRKFIDDNNLIYFSLNPFDCNLSVADIFEENGCTAKFRQLFDQSAGIIFFGGPDIQPEIYGEENIHSVVTDPERHLFELSFIFHLLGNPRNQNFVPFMKARSDYLLTGFCLGLQTINVAAGGSLWQDIPAQVYHKETFEEIVEIDRENLHRNYWPEVQSAENMMGINLHPVIFTAHPFFGKTIKIRKKEKPRSYSSHHQAIKELAPNFEVTAVSPDGKIIEAIAHARYPHVFASQFHPEVSALFEDREKWRFAPGDKIRTMHQIIGKTGYNFHIKYWAHISNIINRAH